MRGGMGILGSIAIELAIPEKLECYILDFYFFGAECWCGLGLGGDEMVCFLLRIVSEVLENGSKSEKKLEICNPCQQVE